MCPSCCFGKWLDRLEARSPKNVAIVAIANKLARIAWAVLTAVRCIPQYSARKGKTEIALRFPLSLTTATTTSSYQVCKHILLMAEQVHPAHLEPYGVNGPQLRPLGFSGEGGHGFHHGSK
jgi:hypothetical protein